MIYLDSPSISPELKSLILKMLEKDPAKRATLQVIRSDPYAIYENLLCILRCYIIQSPHDINKNFINELFVILNVPYSISTKIFF